ncbi:MAG: hypothetical protein ACO22R_05375 [Chitinophagaceae bacterium]|jgi:hypothetical protein
MRRAMNVVDYQQITMRQVWKNTGMPNLRRAKVAKTGEIAIKLLDFAVE